MTPAFEWLPIFFILLMGFAVLVYAIMDGYDLGVGILMPMDHPNQRDTMIASIGPFWDANETWLVLAVGILLIAFPAAHSLVLQHLYLPVTIMLIGLILRGVSFDFRAKVHADKKDRWDKIFKTGSLVTALSQGWMLGRYVMGFDATTSALLFAGLSAVCVTAAYVFIGGAWLIMKCEGELQQRAAKWTRIAGWITASGLISVSLVNVSLSEATMIKWLSFPQVILMMPIPVLSAFLLILTDRYLRHFPHNQDFGCWIPFTSAAVIFFLSIQGLAYTFFPYVIAGQMTIWQAASATESLQFIFYGIVVVVPAILAYTVFSYRVFWGKATDLEYY